MKSFTSRSFRELYASLPAHVQQKAKRAYRLRRLNPSHPGLNKFTSVAKLGASARFLGNGDVAIADGSSEDEFFPVARGPFRLSSRWRWTLVKTSGQWKTVSLHLSSNVFNNSLIDEAKRALWFAELGGLIVGLLPGWFFDRIGQWGLRFFTKARSGV